MGCCSNLGMLGITVSTCNAGRLSGMGIKLRSGTCKLCILISVLSPWPQFYFTGKEFSQVILREPGGCSQPIWSVFQWWSLRLQSWALAGSASNRATLAALRLPGLHTSSDPWQDYVVLGISSRSEYAAHISNPYI